MRIDYRTPMEPYRRLWAKVANQTRKLREAGQVVTLRPEGRPQGNVLLSYFTDPFLLKPGQPVPHWHSQQTESLEMARAFLDLGYNVEVIQYSNDLFRPKKRDYSFLIDCRHNMERLSALVDSACIKIQHIDVAHILFQNAAESRRLLDLQQRRGVTLPPQRSEMPNRGIEHADCGTILGNRFTMDTFRYAGKPLYPVPIITPLVFPWPEHKDFNACRKRFLWFGSGGFVRKGLDLALEAFAQMPDYHLTVCGPIHGEKDFQQAYHKELYETPNIHTVGWVDVNSPRFTEIADTCIGLIFPSSCEGQSGGVAVSLQASLIPVISYESGVDVDDFGVILKNSSIEEIQRSVRGVSEWPAADLKAKARRAWEYARANHTRDRFADAYRAALSQIIATNASRSREKSGPLVASRSAP